MLLWRNWIAHVPSKHKVAGSIPVKSTIVRIAQMAEHGSYEPGVMGSIPIMNT